jgi:hypothetical protein
METNTKKYYRKVYAQRNQEMRNNPAQYPIGHSEDDKNTYNFWNIKHPFKYYDYENFLMFLKEPLENHTLTNMHVGDKAFEYPTIYDPTYPQRQDNSISFIEKYEQKWPYRTKPIQRMY